MKTNQIVQDYIIAIRTTDRTYYLRRQQQLNVR